MELTAFEASQALASFTFVTDIVSWQFKDRKSILTCFMIGALCYGAHFALLGAWTGAALSMLAIGRFFTAMKCPGDKRALGVFVLLGCVVTAVTYSSPVNLLAGAGTVCGTLGSFQKEDKHLRLFTMGATTLWILHNVIVWTPVGILLEAGFLISNMVGFVRYYGRD